MAKEEQQPTMTMRRGQLLIETPRTVKPGDIYFDIQEKMCIKISTIEEGIINGEDAITRAPLRVHSNVENLRHLVVEDVITHERFETAYDLQSYLYRCGKTDNFKFYDRTNHKHEIQEAVILCHSINQTSLVKIMDVMATAYGNYVAGQKMKKEPAKKFSDWHFDVSI